MHRPPGPCPAARPGQERLRPPGRPGQCGEFDLGQVAAQTAQLAHHLRRRVAPRPWRAAPCRSRMERPEEGQRRHPQPRRPRHSGKNLRRRLGPQAERAMPMQSDAAQPLQQVLPLAAQTARDMNGEMVDPPVALQIVRKPVGMAMRRPRPARPVQAVGQTWAAPQRLGPAHHRRPCRLGQTQRANNGRQRRRLQPPDAQRARDRRAGAGRGLSLHPILPGHW